MECAVDVVLMFERFILVLFFVVLLNSNVGVAGSLYNDITINIVDGDNNEFNAEVVRWWPLAKQNDKHELKCFNSQCEIQILKEAWSGAIVITASTSIVDPEDASCWSLYHGEVLLNSPAEKIKIVMRYKNIICK